MRTNMQPVNRPMMPNPARAVLAGNGSLSVRILGAGRVAQTAKPPQGSTSSGYRIAGTVVSKADARPLARVRVTLREAKEQQKFESMVTSEDGKFEFRDVPAGKYSLEGGKRGFIFARYDQHEQFSTAIVTGAGLDTETLVLRLAPNAVIAGKVLDEFGEPVRHATVTVYYDDHSTGMDQIHQFRSAQTDDLGAYEVTPLRPGTYFLSANAKPWYAVHPPSEPRQSGSARSRSANLVSEENQSADDPPAVDRSLNVTYPVTYYPDVEAADDAAPISIQGGERVEADFHLNPVPSLRLLFRVPEGNNHQFIVPQLQQPAFDGSIPVQASGTQRVAPGVMEVTGVPAGRYNFRLFANGSALQMDGVDFTKDGELIDTSKSEAASQVKCSVQVPGEPTIPANLTVALRSGGRGIAVARPVDSKGKRNFQMLPLAATR